MTRPRSSPWLDLAAAGPVAYPSGKVRTVLTWETRCAACVRRFTFTSARKPRDDDLRRLCDRHYTTRGDLVRSIRRSLAAQGDSEKLISLMTMSSG